MSRDSGAGAYSHGIAWPSPSPQLLGARVLVVATAPTPTAGRDSGVAAALASDLVSDVPDGRSVSVVIARPLWHRGSSAPDRERGR